MAQLDNSMDRLHELAEQINAAADQVNSVILETEQRLRETGAGIETWIDLASDLQLGWSRLGKSFSLTVRNVHAGTSHASSDAVPLRNASRRVRVLASLRLQDLIGALVANAEQMLADFAGKFDPEFIGATEATHSTEFVPILPPGGDEF